MSCLALATAIASAAHADEPGGAAPRIDIAANRLANALAELSRETGVSIGTDGALPDRPTPAVHGRMSVGAALQRVLAGTGWRARQVGPHAWRIERAPATANRPAPRPMPRADPAPPPVAVESEPIIVTGLKRPSLLESAPISVTVVTLDAAEDLRGTTGTARIAAQAEGLALTSLGPGRNRMFLRGVADSALNGESQSTVAVVLNGARLTFAAPDPDIRLVDVERVELLKGPQGALYGSGALGGIYNIVSRAPDVHDASLTTTATLDAISGGQAQIGGSVIANLPISRGTAALRIVGYSASSPGWIDTGDRADSNRSRVIGGRAALGVDLGGGWQADVNALAQWLGSDDSQYVYRSGARSRPAQLPEAHDNDLQHGAVHISGPTPLGQLTVHSGLTMHEVGDTLDATIGADSFALTNPQTLEDERQYRIWDHEARLAGRWGQASWQAGLSWLVAHQSEVATLANTTGQSLTVDDDHRRTTELALFGDMSLPLGGDLTLDGGGRLFRATVREQRVVGSMTVERHRDRVGFTPTIALSWQPDRRQMAWLRYAAASRPGGSDIGPTGELELLDSDELQSLEAGWRRTLGGGIHLELSGWWSRWSHIQSDVLLTNGLVETVNAGTGQMRGVEATLTARTTDGWQARFGGSLSDARLIRTTLPFEVDDNSLPVVPSYVVRADLHHSWSIGRTDVTAGASLRYVGPSHLSFDPTVDRPMGDLVESRVDVTIHRGSWLAALAIDNPLGQHGNAFAFGNPFRFRTMRQFTPQAPTSVTLSLIRQF